ncbi:recombinase RecA [Candidatus Acetothermia bacterium]|jgi:recombination protein RecA|nr:recombinase RecA [Candidatus Acetothermia bacterium]MCI2431919.1 recombinase RecA [Candidatus Acetothermia bacterium]MCI2437348.1 recombinase RecA [Candidatus Acetothermia bacterium]
MGKQEVLNSVLDGLRRKYGEGAIMWLGEQSKLPVETIPTGSLALDVALGIGGVPRGRIVEIFGPESSGKTTLALHILAQAQKRGGVVSFIDAEHALDPSYARVIGVDLDKILLSQPNSGEQALEIMETLVRSGAVDIIVVDSVAALVPEAEIAGAMGDAQVGLQARLMSQAMRKLAAAISQSKTTVVFINQIRQTISGTGWGPTTTTTGGLALKFYSSVRMEIKRLGSIEEGDNRVGSETVVKVVKNKLAPPFKEAKFDIIYGKGIVYERELIKTGEQLGLVKKSGSWFNLGETRLGQGIANAAAFLEANKEVAQQLERAIREKAGLALPSTNGQPEQAASAEEESSLSTEPERPARRGTRKSAATLLAAAPESSNGA